MDKRLPLDEAVRRHVRDGDLVYAAGFTHLIPFAAAHEVIRQRRRGLVLARATPDLVYEQMVAAGCARRLVFSYMGNPGVGALRVLRAAIERGEIEWEEYSHFGMITRLAAGAAGLPFLPMRPTGPADLPRVNPSYRTVTDPWSGEEVVVLPALRPDVALVHVQRADAEGNAHVWGITGDVKEAAFAARRVVLTAEEIVPPEVIRADPNRTLIPGMIVDAVCHVPGGAHPSYVHDYYDRDNRFYIEWERLDEAGVADYLERFVHAVPDRAAYLERLGAGRWAGLAFPPAAPPAARAPGAPHAR